MWTSRCPAGLAYLPDDLVDDAHIFDVAVVAAVRRHDPGVGDIKALQPVIFPESDVLFILEAGKIGADESVDDYALRLEAEKKKLKNKNIAVVAARSLYVKMDGTIAEVNNASIGASMYLARRSSSPWVSSTSMSSCSSGSPALRTSRTILAYDWGDVDFQMPGLNIQVQEVSYNDELEKEVVYGAGQKPRGYGEGNYKSEGKISVALARPMSTWIVRI